MGRNVKNRMISMRVTEEQFQYLESVAQRIRKITGLKVTRASIILKLMEYGHPILDQKFPGPEIENDIDIVMDEKEELED